MSSLCSAVNVLFKDGLGAVVGTGRDPETDRIVELIKFLLDVGVGDVWMEPITTLQSNGWLEFAGIPSTAYPAISPDRQFAEKIHAYTLPRGEGVKNSRLKERI